ncbi:uncharacterized protein BDR25DRAFT_363539 [Lindgomyces ingoldianus]|uniref:Uncharacterized protein n=1 Tax=Lindgomyces ingoldianus TaxID=673940 RepID=A0ACB6Q7G2_9PLEO|nr:uncharacterized protein BDR25DRAFT_363539 [Lindgomyces ingoldianus]KAF2462798.1 hypothetical protein BDR25DRAFT_363539 [Lindgomyces ingoldianus]
MDGACPVHMYELDTAVAFVLGPDLWKYRKQRCPFSEVHEGGSAKEIVSLPEIPEFLEREPFLRKVTQGLLLCIMLSPLSLYDRMAEVNIENVHTDDTVVSAIASVQAILTINVPQTTHQSFPARSGKSLSVLYFTLNATITNISLYICVFSALLDTLHVFLTLGEPEGLRYIHHLSSYKIRVSLVFILKESCPWLYLNDNCQSWKGLQMCIRNNDLHIPGLTCPRPPTISTTSPFFIPSQSQQSRIRGLAIHCNGVSPSYHGSQYQIPLTLGNSCHCGLEYGTLYLFSNGIFTEVSLPSPFEIEIAVSPIALDISPPNVGIYVSKGGIYDFANDVAGSSPAFSGRRKVSDSITNTVSKMPNPGANLYAAMQLDFRIIGEKQYVASRLIEPVSERMVMRRIFRDNWLRNLIVIRKGSHSCSITWIIIQTTKSREGNFEDPIAKNFASSPESRWRGEKDTAIILKGFTPCDPTRNGNPYKVIIRITPAHWHRWYTLQNRVCCGNFRLFTSRSSPARAPHRRAAVPHNPAHGPSDTQSTQNFLPYQPLPSWKRVRTAFLRELSLKRL